MKVPRPLLTHLPGPGLSSALQALALLFPSAAAFLAFFRPIWDPDTFWHLAAGRQMAWTGRWLTTESFSFTASGKPWEDTEWLFHGLLFPLYRAGGEPLLVVLTALAGLLALLQMYRLVRLAGGGALAFGMAVLAILPAVADRIRCRPDLVTFLFMGILAEALWRNLPPKRGAPPAFLGGGAPLRDLCLFLALLFGFWANLHGGWAYGAALLAALLSGTLLDGLVARHLSPLRAARCLWVGLSALFALFLTPYTWRVPWFPIRHAFALADPSLIPIEEWARTPLLTYRGALLALSVALILTMAMKRRPLALIFPAGLQVLLGFLWVRYPAISFLLLAPLAVGEILDTPWRPSPRWREAMTWVLWTSLLCASVGVGLRAWPDARIRWDLSAMYPEGEVRFLQRHRLSGNLLNPYTSGGYLDWFYYPLGRVFMDGRYFPFTGELSDYFRSLTSLDDFHRFLDRRGVELALHPYPEYRMPADGPGQPPRGALAQLYPPATWAPVHFGSWGGLFLRRLPRWERVISETEYRILWPDDALHLRRALRDGEVEAGALGEEVRRCLDEAPRAPMRGDLEKLLRTVEEAGV